MYYTPLLFINVVSKCYKYVSYGMVSSTRNMNVICSKHWFKKSVHQQCIGWCKTLKSQTRSDATSG